MLATGTPSDTPLLDFGLQLNVIYDAIQLLYSAQCYVHLCCRTTSGENIDVCIVSLTTLFTGAKLSWT